MRALQWLCTPCVACTPHTPQVSGQTAVARFVRRLPHSIAVLKSCWCLATWRGARCCALNVTRSRMQVEQSLLEKAAAQAAKVVLNEDLKKTDEMAPPQSPASTFQQARSARWQPRSGTRSIGWSGRRHYQHVTPALKTVHSPVHAGPQL